MTHKQKQAVGGVLAAIFAAAIIWMETEHKPADGCQPCDCSDAIGLPGDATALAADASAVTAVTE